MHFWSISFGTIRRVQTRLLRHTIHLLRHTIHHHDTRLSVKRQWVLLLCRCPFSVGYARSWAPCARCRAICVYIYKYMYINIFLQMYVCIHTYICKYIYKRVYKFIRMHRYVHIMNEFKICECTKKEGYCRYKFGECSFCLYICIYMYKYICIHVHVFLCTHVFSYT